MGDEGKMICMRLWRDDWFRIPPSIFGSILAIWCITRKVRSFSLMQFVQGGRTRRANERVWRRADIVTIKTCGSRLSFHTASSDGRIFHWRHVLDQKRRRFVAVNTYGSTSEGLNRNFVSLLRSVIALGIFVVFAMIPPRQIALTAERK